MGIGLRMVERMLGVGGLVGIGGRVYMGLKGVDDILVCMWFWI